WFLYFSKHCSLRTERKKGLFRYISLNIIPNHQKDLTQKTDKRKEQIGREMYIIHEIILKQKYSIYQEDIEKQDDL
ncbi:hypothetical protein OFM39_34255, partial [Escherichia coli]|nr:hypothetical protein [Escherichia coli]